MAASPGPSTPDSRHRARYRPELADPRPPGEGSTIDHGTRDSHALTLSEQLLLVCWDAERGKVSSHCAATLAPGLGGAAVVDALAAEVIAIEDGQVHLLAASSDPLLEDLVEEAGRDRRRPLTVEKLVPRIGTARRQTLVRDRLVERGVLHHEEQRILGIFPSTRHPVADVALYHQLREGVRDLVTERRDPADAEPSLVMLAALSGTVGAINLLVSDRRERRSAKARADAFAEGHGVTTEVSTAIAEAHTAMVAAMAAVTAATTAAAASSSSSSSSC